MYDIIHLFVNKLLFITIKILNIFKKKKYI